MNFEINANEVQFAHLNVRSEKHGDEDVTAVDLKMIWTTGNEALALFDRRLAALIYGIETEQQGLEIFGPKAVRAFPAMAPLKWDEDVTGLRLTIQQGLGGKSDLVLADCSADKFVIEPLDGGTVKIQFRMQAECTDEKILGRLGMLIERDLPMTITRDEDLLRQGSIVTALPTAKDKRQKTVEEAFTGSAE